MKTCLTPTQKAIKRKSIPFFWLLLKYFNWPDISVALISFAISVVITGGLHIDGLMDTADGIGAGPSKRVEAMKDSRVGAIGVQSLIIILILSLYLIYILKDPFRSLVPLHLPTLQVQSMTFYQSF